MQKAGRRFFFCLLFASVVIDVRAQEKEEHLMSGDASAIQMFVLYNYRNLIMDVAEGGGEYLDALFGLCKTPAADKKLASKSFRRELVSDQDKFHFAREMANSYEKHSVCYW